MALVTLANSAPTSVTLDNTIVKETAPGSQTTGGMIIGTLVTTDPDQGDTFTYTIVDANGNAVTDSLFEIVRPDPAGPFKIALKQDAVLDHETTPTYTIKVKATDSGNLSVTNDITITIENVDEAPTDLTLSKYTIAEKSPVGTVVGTLQVADPEMDGPFFYSIVDAQGNQVLDPLFEIVPATTPNGTVYNIALKQGASLNYEASSQHTLKVMVTDNAGLSFTKDITVETTDVNEAPYSVGITNTTIAENSPAGTIVGTLIGYDPDLVENFTYQLVNANGNPDTTSPFEIVQADTPEGTVYNLVLKNGVNLDYESANKSYNIRVKVIDKGGLSYTAPMKINVTNINESPYNIKLSNNLISEKAIGGMVVGALGTDDVDANDIFSYAIVDAAGNPVQDKMFEILLDPLNGYVIALKQGAVLDYETTRQYTLKIKSTDLGGLSVIRDVVVRVGDESEMPVITAKSFSKTIKDNPDTAMPFIDVSFSDPDVGEILTVAVKLDTPGKGWLSTVGGVGTFDSKTGIYTVSGTALQVTNDIRSLIFNPADRPYASALNPFETTTFTISVTDETYVVQSSAVITVTSDGSRAPTGVGLDNRTIDELSEKGTVVGTLMPGDTNTDEKFTYTLLDNAGGRFVLQGDKIIVADGIKLDFEQAATHKIKVKVADRSGATAESEITINVGDVENESTNGSTTADTLVGGANSDTIGGGLGKDVLTGGMGSDIFVFNTKLSGTNVDVINDFSVVDDKFWLDNAIFKKLGAGTPEAPIKLDASFFIVGTKALDKNDYVIYNKDTGALMYDADGSGRGKAIKIATLTPGLDLKADHFFVI